MNRPINPRPSAVASPSAANATRPGGRKMVVPFPAVTTSGPSSQTASPISTFIDLEIEARKCRTLEELRYVITNTTGRLAPFEQAFLAEPEPTGDWSVTLSSGVPAVDRHTRIVRTLDGWLRRPSGRETLAAGEMRLINLERELAEGTFKDGVFSAPYAVCLPIRGRDGRSLAALIALKPEIWLPQQTALFLPLADAYGHAWAALQPSHPTPLQRARRYLTGSRVMLAGVGMTLLAAFVQVPMSALAPAEVVATEPMLVTAPLDGVISEILAPPGAYVEKGFPIVRLVDVKYRADAEVAARNKAVAEAKHFRFVQSATVNSKDLAEVAITRAELDVATAELAYATELLARAEIRAERSGLLIYSAKSDWLGKPVSVGERLMEIGDPQRTEIRIDLAVADAIALKAGGKVTLFLDGDPMRAVRGTIVQTSYRPSLTGDQQLAFRIRAEFDDAQPRRIGLRGTARVSGDHVSLWLYLLRRPISALRQRFGL